MGTPPYASKEKGCFCSVCKKSIKGNVNPEKILTCGLCVLKLLETSIQNKIKLRDAFLEKGDPEAARSIESFIVKEESNGELRPTPIRERISKVTRHVDRRIGRVSKTRLSMG